MNNQNISKKFKINWINIPIFIWVFIFIIIALWNKPAEPKTIDEVTADITLPTIQCGMCYKTITNALNKIKGIKDFSIDLSNKKVTVTYDDVLTNLSKIEYAITKAGYDANDKKADPEAYEQLHGCCKVK